MMMLQLSISKKIRHKHTNVTLHLHLKVFESFISFLSDFYTIFRRTFVLALLHRKKCIQKKKVEIYFFFSNNKHKGSH